VTLAVEILPRPGVHVYAPDVGGGYQGLAFSVEPQPHFSAGPPRYPAPAPIRLPWTDESLSGYTGPARIEFDISLGTRQELAALLEAGEGLTVEGAVALQACSDSVCWPPRTIRVAWEFDLIPPDLERVPEPLQHKPGV
jgi:DsbC/DsbD-like thiol-disulfide interchange protein